MDTHKKSDLESDQKLERNLNHPILADFKAEKSAPFSYLKQPPKNQPADMLTMAISAARAMSKTSPSKRFPHSSLEHRKTLKLK